MELIKIKDPYFDDVLRGWLVTNINWWLRAKKLAAWYELDDLLQDGYMCFHKCRSKFVPKDAGPEPSKEDRRRFMAFFQMSFKNHLIDLTNRKTSTPELAFAALPEAQADAIETWTESAAELSDAPLATLLAQAPSEIAEMLKQILIDGVADVPYLKTRLRKKFLPGCATPRIVKGKKRIRETTVEHYDRCLGKTGVVAKLRQYFMGYQGDKDPLLDKLVKCLFRQDGDPAVWVSESNQQEQE